MNRQVLGDNPLTRRHDNVFRKTESTETTRSPSTVSPDTASAASMLAADNRVQFVLSPRHLQILDDLCYQVRRHTRYKLNRSEIVRVLIEQLEQSEVQFQRMGSENDFRQHIQEMLHS